jgi:hypothetical protein
MSRKTKLELTWIGKEERPKLEPRILVEDEALSHHAAARRKAVVGEAGDIFDNRLIQGDNLLALKALEAEFAGVESGRERVAHEFEQSSEVWHRRAQVVQCRHMFGPRHQSGPPAQRRNFVHAPPPAFL